FLSLFLAPLLLFVFSFCLFGFCLFSFLRHSEAGGWFPETAERRAAAGDWRGAGQTGGASRAPAAGRAGRSRQCRRVGHVLSISVHWLCALGLQSENLSNGSNRRPGGSNCGALRHRRGAV